LNRGVSPSYKRKDSIRMKNHNILSVRNLSKKYGKSPNYAIQDINLECERGEIVGLLGRNGAGKSTLIKCITGYLAFEEGYILIDGYDIKAEPVKAKACFGYVPDNRPTFEKMTGMEYIHFIADIFKVPASVREERIAELQETFELGDSIYNLISSYSQGMTQKVCLMGSLIHMPDLWILDEPLNGLDPQVTKSLREYMKKYREKGKTVLFSSHNLDAVQKICDRAVIINAGRLVETLDVQNFKDLNPEMSLEEFFLDRYGDKI
jgi:ABC-2 type transport system ATP-binding protein